MAVATLNVTKVALEPNDVIRLAHVCLNYKKGDEGSDLQCPNTLEAFEVNRELTHMGLPFDASHSFSKLAQAGLLNTCELTPFDVWNDEDLPSSNVKWGRSTEEHYVKPELAAIVQALVRGTSKDQILSETVQVLEELDNNMLDLSALRAPNQL